MSFILNSKNRTLTVKISGELDLVSANDFREKVDQALEEMVGRNLLVDLSKVSFIDSSGLGVLLGRYRKLKLQEGEMVLYGLSTGVKRILEMSGVLSIIPVCATEKDAWKLIERKVFKEA